MTVINIIDKILNGEYFITNFIFTILIISIFIIAIGRLFIRGAEIKESHEFATKNDLLPIIRDLSEVKDTLRNHGVQFRANNERITRLGLLFRK
jgi:hypothetical protein